MAIDDALRAILDDWRDIEPLLTVKELENLADADFGSGFGVTRSARPAADPVGPDLGSVIFEIVSPALPAGHPAWQALAAQAQAGQDTDPPLPLAPGLDLMDLAADALDSPLTAVDAVADALAERSRSALLAAGVVADGPALRADGLWLSVEADRRTFYPLFQFAAMSPYRQYEIVARLRPQLDADSDPAGAAAWWLTPSPWLAGATPAELLGTEREAEIAYAADQLSNDSW